jgi:hypothetical protein
MELEKERETERLKEKEKERSKLMKDKFVSTKVTMTQQPMPKDVLQLVSQVAETADFAPTTPNVELNPIGHSTTMLPVPSPIESPSLVSLNDRAELELKFGVAEKKLGKKPKHPMCLLRVGFYILFPCTVLFVDVFNVHTHSCHRSG